MDKQSIRKFVITSGAVVLAVTASGAGSAHAEAVAVSERYAARAGSQASDLSLFGRRLAFGSATVNSELDAVGGALQTSATGLGSTLAGSATKSVARLDDASAPGGSKCATPPVGAVLASAGGRSVAAGPLPGVTVESVCGAASVTGDPQAFTAVASGGHTRMVVKLDQAIGTQIRDLIPTLGQNVLDTPVGDLLAPAAAPQAQAAVQAVNGLLRTIVPGVALEKLEPKQTVGSLIERLQTGDLVRVDLSGASVRNAGDAGLFVSEALNRGGTIDVLPELRGPNSAPLLRISVAESRAGVMVERAATKAVPLVKNTVVRVEGQLLPDLSPAGPSVVGNLIGGVPLSAVPGGNLPVVGGLLGGGLPFDQLTAGLGVRSGPEHVELGPGQGLSVLCAGAVAPLCSEISVGAASEPRTLPSGLIQAQASTVTVHLFKGLDQLAPGLGGILTEPRVVGAVDTLAARAGLTLGEATGISGLRLVMAGALAEAGGTRVMGADEVQDTPQPNPPAVPETPSETPSLPHTGNPLDGTGLVPILFGAAVGLQVLCRRARTKP